MKDSIEKNEKIKISTKKHYEKSLFKAFKETFLETCLNTTAHAIPNIFRTNHLSIKIIWILLFIVATIFCVYYLIDTISKYYRFEVNVNVKWFENNLEVFPAITICNINPFDSSNSTIKKFLENELADNGLTSKIVATDDNPSINQIRQGMQLLKAYVMSKSNFNLSFASSLSYPLDSMLISCYFNGIKCNSSDFTKFYSYDYGNCYTFNQKTNYTLLKSTSKTGPNNGLSLEIFTGFPGRHDFLIEQRGLYLAVHNNSQKPLTKYDGIKIPVGYATDVGIRRKFFNRLPEPFSKCRMDLDKYSESDSKFVKETISYTRYSKKLCFEICLQNLFVIPGCNCSDPNIPITDSSRTICNTLKQLDCVDNIRDKFDSTDLTESCGELCPEECKSVSYETSINLCDYPTEYYYNIMSDQLNVITKFNKFGNITFAAFKKSVLMVNLFYQELGYTGILESPGNTPDEIFGTIGGQLGLLLGVSVLSMAEIIVCIIEITIKFFNMSKQRQCS